MADSIAQAYVQIVPSAKGIQGELARQFDGEGESIANSLIGKIKGALAAAGIGAAIAGVFKSAISEGSKLEQSLGGIDTLFKGSADKVKAFARDAFSSAGLSANEYMENVTRFSASLISSLGGDTGKAADVANMAIIDMSDNVNKMGNDMTDVQNAYQGFAKQNYSMLDNLRLGYGGTGAEMKRLLADAEKLTGVHYDINNLADVYKAIHAIQDNLDITGTTAKEAATTFSGSFSMMKASAQNLLGYMADSSSQKYITKGLQDLITSTSTFLFGNAIPMIGRFVSAIPAVLAQGMNSLADKLREAGTGGIGEFISGLISQIPAVAKAAGNLAGALVDYIKNNSGKFKEIAHQCVVAFVEGLKELIPMSEETAAKLPSVIETGLKAIALLKVASILQPFVSGFGSTILNAVSTAGNHFKTFFGLMKSGGGVFSNLGTMIAQGTGPMASLAASFVNAGGGLKGFLALIKTLGSSLISAVFSPVGLVIGILAVLGGAFMTLWQTNDNFRNSMIETWNGIVESFNDFCQGIVDRINALGFDFENISEVISSIWNGLCEILAPVFESAWNTIAQIIQGALDIITGILDVFIGLFSGNWSQLWTGCQEIASGIWTGIWGILTGIWDGLVGAFDTILGMCGTSWSEIWNSVAAFGSSIWNGITSTLSGIWNGIVSTASTLFNQAKQTINDIWQQCVNQVKSIWDGVTGTLSGIWNGIVNTARNVFGAVYDAIVGPFQRAKDTVMDIWDWISGHSNVNVKVNQTGPGGGHFEGPHAVGGVFMGPTLLPSVYGNTHLVGEAGPEAILPLREFYRSMDRSIRSGYQAAAADPQLGTVIELLGYIAQRPTTIVMDKKTVGQLVSTEVEKAISKRNDLRSRLQGGGIS